MTKGDMEKAREITGDCQCREGYTSRNLIDHACHYHGMAAQIVAAIAAEREACAELVDVKCGSGTSISAAIRARGNGQ